MASTETKILLRFVLGPLDVAFILAGIVYLVISDWFMGLFLLVISFILTSISLNLQHIRTKSTKELSEGPEELSKQNKLNELSDMEADEIGKVFNYTGYVLLIAFLLTFFHYGIKWYFTIPLSIVLALALPSSLFHLGLFVFRKFIRNY